MFSNPGFLAKAVTLALTAFACSLLLTPLVRAFARRVGAVAAPKADRWHKKPTAMLGGLSIFLVVFVFYLLFLPSTPQGRIILAASTLLFVIGVVDDLIHLKPYQKLVGQVMAASIVTYFGIILPWTGSELVNLALTIFWLVGITNAVNMLDNMDGLAAGVAAIASMFLAFNFYTTGHLAEALALLVFAGALKGFLVYNSNPATIFMGDCGSMFVGFFLAGTALLSVSGGRSRTLLPVLAVPVLILMIPILDTTFVTLLRKLAGRAASRGGRDHMSHRLVAFGMTERHAVWLLYGLAIGSGLLALVVRDVNLDVGLAAIATFTVILTLAGIILANVRVYDESEIAAAEKKPLVAFLVDLSYKRRVFEVTLDAVLVILSYYAANALIWGPISDSPPWELFTHTVPVILFCKMGAFLLAGLYRGIWKYTSLHDGLVFVKAVGSGTLASIVVMSFMFRFDGLSRTVFVLDAFLLFSLITASRLAFRLFGSLIPRNTNRNGPRVLIYGAGDGGELLLRELLNNRDLPYQPIGFIDDDARKINKLIHGYKVFGGIESLEPLCRRQGVKQVLVSTMKLQRAHFEELVRCSERTNFSIKQMKIQLEALDPATTEQNMELDSGGDQWTPPAEIREPLLIEDRPLLPLPGSRSDRQSH